MFLSTSKIMLSKQIFSILELEMKSTLQNYNTELMETKNQNGKLNSEFQCFF